MRSDVTVLARIRQGLGIEIDPVSWLEKAVSLAGGILAIYCVMVVSRSALQLSGSTMLIASMGASAVLLFGVPHGALSQPWPVIMGHLISALIGVTCARWIQDPFFAGACAVGFSIAVMHQFKCIHPPGGATALTAVVGGPAVLQLGYTFVLTPVLVNALIMVGVALVFNNLFAWRRYPAALMQRTAKPSSTPITHEDVVEALRQIDSFVDITEEDLVRLFEILKQAQALKAPAIQEKPKSTWGMQRRA